jgi:hypothetical protein
MAAWSRSDLPPEALTDASRIGIVLLVDSKLTEAPAADEVGLLASWRSDGIGLLTVAALGLLAAGLFAWFLAMTDQLLPHDVAWLTISEPELRAVADGRLVHFMGHDRAAFGGTLIAIGVLYLWLIRFPLAEGRPWAWWLLAVGASLGFLTFLSYLGTGYLDSWHGLATLILLPLFGLGLVRARPARSLSDGIRTLLIPGERPRAWSRAWLGRSLLLLTAFGMLVAGLVIVTVGTLVVFVPQDLEFIGLDRAALDAIDPRLVPLIAHDRAGFGGGLATTGLTVLGCVWCGRSTLARWEALLVAGIAGFGAAVGVHGLIGYLDLSHVGPAILGAGIFIAGIVLSRPSPAVRPAA